MAHSVSFLGTQLTFPIVKSRLYVFFCVVLTLSDGVDELDDSQSVVLLQVIELFGGFVGIGLLGV